MAEFQEVTKLWRRMCISMDSNDPYRKCERCSLGEENICSLEISNIQDDELHRVEEKVMAWAAEHPEPVYPTWEEWLVDNGVFASDDVRFHGDYRFYMNDRPMCNIPTEKIYSQIPADIAEKLGLQPKEG